jgi:hypothetical protein
MDPSARDLVEEVTRGPLEASSSWRARLERVVGGFLVASAGMGLLAWLTLSLGEVLGGSGGSVEVGGFPAPGRLGTILLTAVVFALAGTQGILGVGLFRQRAWVGWFGLLYVLGTVVGAGLLRVLPVGLWTSVTAALPGTLPTWVFLARRARGNVEAGQDR